MKKLDTELMIDEESELILKVIRECKEKGLTTNVDLELAESERIMLEKEQNTSNTKSKGLNFAF